MILDGWGLGTKKSADAIQLTHTPFFDYLMEKYPHSTLKTFGNYVGLPEGQMGNSEVGHLNIGAGRIVFQDLLRINNDIESGEFYENETLNQAFAEAEKENKTVHFMGIFSDGGVHGHIRHLEALLKASDKYKIKEKYVHAFTDGRDTSPTGGIDYFKEMLPVFKEHDARLASVIGRYYAMDRDNRMNRAALAYNLLVKGEGKYCKDILDCIRVAYANDVTDEFLPALRCLNGKEGLIADGDLVIFYNFRTDRPRQLTSMLTQMNYPEQGTKALDIDMITMTQYEKDFKGIKTLYSKDVIKNSLGELVSNAGLTQLRIAETEKFPHVTYFFSGGREKEYEGEKRILIPSPKVATYDLQPEMSAYKVTDACVATIEDEAPDFICLNFANPDMVGHTGVLEAAKYACMVIDRCMGQVVRAALNKDYGIIIIADHGNADYMINEDGSPNTAHTKNLVPCIYVSNDGVSSSMSDGILADVAPTLCEILGLKKADEMTGKSLINR